MTAEPSEIKTLYKVYRPGRDVPQLVDAMVPAWSPDAFLEAILAPIVGGPIQHIVVRHDGQIVDMVVNEFRDPEGHELNEAATRIFQDSFASVEPDFNRERMPVIKGVAVLFDRQLFQKKVPDIARRQLPPE